MILCYMMAWGLSTGCLRRPCLKIKKVTCREARGQPGGVCSMSYACFLTDLIHSVLKGGDSNLVSSILWQSL